MRLGFLLLLLTGVTSLLQGGVPTITPAKTIRFPGSGIDHAQFVDEKTVVVGSGWSREDGIQVFSIEKDDRLSFRSSLKARGYVVEKPICIGGLVFYPNLCSVGVADLSDPASPVLDSLLAFTNGSRIRSRNGKIFVKSDGGTLVYGINEKLRLPVLESFETNTVADFFAPEKKDERIKLLPGVKDAVFCGNRALSVNGKKSVMELYGLENGEAILHSETPFLNALGTIAVKGDVAYILSPGTYRSVHMLNLKGEGERRNFCGSIFSDEIPVTNTFMTIGMQTAGVVGLFGEDKLIVDDGVASVGENGIEWIKKPGKAVSNYSFSGSRVAIASSSECRVVDMNDPFSVVYTYAPTSLVHIVGCHLDGERLFLTWLPKTKINHDFIYNQPKTGFIGAFDLKKSEGGVIKEPESVVEIPPAVTTLLVGGRYLYAPSYRGDFSIVDAEDMGSLKVVGNKKLLRNSSFKIKSHLGRVFCQDGSRVLELDVEDAVNPKVARIFTRGEAGAPGVDDFAFWGKNLYSLSHSSLDVFDIDGARAETFVTYGGDCKADVISPVEAEVAVLKANGETFLPRLPSHRTGIAIDREKKLVIMASPTLPGVKGGYVALANVTNPEKPAVRGFLQIAGNPFAVAINDAKCEVAVVDNYNLYVLSYGRDNGLKLLRKVKVSDNPVFGPQGVDYDMRGNILLALGRGGIGLWDGKKLVNDFIGADRISGLFVNNVKCSCDDLLISLDNYGYAVGKMRYDMQRGILNDLTFTRIKGGNVMKVIRENGEIYAAAGLLPIYHDGKVGKGGRYHNYFLGAAYDLDFTDDGKIAVADGESGLVVYSQRECDDLGAPKLICETPPGADGTPLTYATSLCSDGTLIYLNDFFCGLRIFDLSKELAKEVGHLQIKAVVSEDE